MVLFYQDTRTPWSALQYEASGGCDVHTDTHFSLTFKPQKSFY